MSQSLPSESKKTASNHLTTDTLNRLFWLAGRDANAVGVGGATES